MKTAQDIEDEFDRFFDLLGYDRVSTIVGDSPNFSNADYVRTEYRSVVELKILDKDFFANGGLIDRFNTLITVPENVNPDGTGQYRFSLPDENREGKSDSFEEPIRRILKKANKQIKETVNHLFDGEGCGFLFLAMNKFQSISPELVRQTVDDLLSREFSSISGYTICTPTWGVRIPNSDSAHPMCLPSVPHGSPEQVREYWYAVGQAWCDFVTEGGHA